MDKETKIALVLAEIVLEAVNFTTAMADEDVEPPIDFSLPVVDLVDTFVERWATHRNWIRKVRQGFGSQQ